MVEADDARKKRIAKALARLKSGDALAVRDFANAVGSHGVKDYEARWKDELAMRDEFAEKPAAIKEYERRLNIADLHYNRGEGLSSKRNQKRGADGLTASARAYNQADTAYEHALEHLEQMLQLDPGLYAWLDREVSFEPDSESTPGIDPVSIPRAVTSRSCNRQSQGMAAKKTKADIKREVLEEALAEIEHKEERIRQALAKLDAEERSVLKEKLDKLKQQDV